MSAINRVLLWCRLSKWDGELPKVKELYRLETTNRCLLAVGRKFNGGRIAFLLDTRKQAIDVEEEIAGRMFSFEARLKYLEREWQRRTAKESWPTPEYELLMPKLFREE